MALLKGFLPTGPPNRQSSTVDLFEQAQGPSLMNPAPYTQEKRHSTHRSVGSVVVRFLGLPSRILEYEPTKKDPFWDYLLGS